MTDEKLLVKFLEQSNIEYDRSTDRVDDTVTYTIMSDCGSWHGYRGFWFEFIFDKDGKFISTGALE